ncbi:hypothetical protein AB0M43_11515 [Longispora sp. NPDC051575]
MKIIDRVLKLVLPTATAKAAPVKGRCVPGCGGDGVYWASHNSGKRPCC